MKLPDLDLFLTAEDIGDKNRIKFTTEGRIVSKDETGFDHDSFEIGIMLPSSEKRAWTMNKTSQRMVARLFGQDTANWVGKEVTLITTEQNVRGKMKKVIYVEGSDTPQPPVTAEKVP